MNRPNLLTNGLRLALRNWPCILWAYGANLLFGLLAAVPFSASLGRYLDHSLAAQQIAGTLDISYLGELAGHLSRAGVFPVATNSSLLLAAVEMLVLFLLTAGTLHVYLTADRPRLSVLLRAGVEYFWRFVRITLFTALIAGPVLAALMGARAALLKQAAEVHSERAMFHRSLITGFIVLLAGLLLRLWFDLVELQTVRNGAIGERRVRKTLLPALRLLLRNFLSLAVGYLLAGALGVGALLLCLLLWKDLVPAGAVLLAFVISQLGLLLLLAARFWQRGIAATLVLAQEPLIQEPLILETVAPAVVEPSPISARESTPVLVREGDALVETAPSAATLPPESELASPIEPAPEPLTGNPSISTPADVPEPSLRDPSLRDLVQKLQKEPWARPEISPVREDLFPRTTAPRPDPSAAPSADADTPASLKPAEEPSTPVDAASGSATPSDAPARSNPEPDDSGKR